MKQNNITMDQIVVFTLDELKYALPLNSVSRVIHAVEIRKLPKAPEIICGIINVKGLIIPVLDVRKRFGLLAREIMPDDELIIADTGKRSIALLIDHVIGVQNVDFESQVRTKDTMPFAGYIQGVLKINDELVLIYDLEQFINLDEEMELENALAKTKK